MLETQPPVATSDGRRLKGQRTRDEILQAAAQTATQDGLEGLTIGRLAQQTGMSKSGLFAHFGSKEDLQLAVVDHAAAIFRQHALQPSLDQPSPLGRLSGVCEGWMSYLEQRVFPGGCFFSNVSVEFGSRPGPVRDRIRYWMERLTTLMEGLVEEAQLRDELAPDIEPAQLVFELHALIQEANYSHQLMRDNRALRRARIGIKARLEAVSAREADR